MFNHYSKSFIIWCIFLFKTPYVYSLQSIPSSPQNSIGGDSIRGRDGTTCTQGSHNGPTLDFGVTATKNANNSDNSEPNIINNYYTNQQSTSNFNGGDVGVYARIVIPLGNDINRVDCTQLYNLEIERLKIELENLKKQGSSSITVE